MMLKLAILYLLPLVDQNEKSKIDKLELTMNVGKVLLAILVSQNLSQRRQKSFHLMNNADMTKLKSILSRPSNNFQALHSAPARSHAIEFK